MNVKNDVQVYLYKDIMDLQKQLVEQMIQMLPVQNMQTDMSNNDLIKQTPPPNPDGNISKYA